MIACLLDLISAHVSLAQAVTATVAVGALSKQLNRVVERKKLAGHELVCNCSYVW